MVYRVAALCSSLRLNSISSYAYAMFLFIHSSVDGNLDCFHPLAPVNNSSVNTDLSVSGMCFNITTR